MQSGLPYHAIYIRNKNVNGKGYILQRLYNLRLSDEEDNLSAVIKVVKTVEGRVSRVERKLLSHTVLRLTMQRL